MTKKTLEKTFYLIAWYEMGQLRNFIKIGDDKEEIKKWTDYEGEQIQIWDYDDNYYLVSSINCTLFNE